MEAQCTANIAQVQKKKIKKNTKLLFLVIIAQMKRTATDFLKSVGK